MLIVFILEMIYQKEQETIKLFSKISIQEITLAGFFLAIGIISDAFIRINNLVFLTFSIYILIGLIFRLFIGIIVAFLIDVFQLLLRGLLGFWFWSLQIEPAIIILITFMFKHLIFLFKDKKNFIYFVFLTLIIFISFSIFAFITNIDNFSFEKQVRKNKLETSQALISRLFVYYFSLIGFCFLIGLFIYQIYLFLNKKKNNEYMIIFTLILTISILIDWIYHPWAVQEWRRAVLNIEYNFLLYRATFLSGIFKSLFHIFLSILVVPITYKVYKFKFKSFSKKIYNFKMIKKSLYWITIFFYYILGLWIFEFIPYFKKNFLPLWRFINKMFISNAAVLFTSFGLPMIFILIFGAFMQIKQVFPGVVGQIAIIVLCVNIPMLLVNFRKSSVLKRLAASNIKNRNVLLSFVLYGFLISMVSSAMLFLLTIIVYGNTTKPAIGQIEDQVAFVKLISEVNWLSFIFSFFLLLVLSGGIGILVAKVSRNEMIAMALGLVILIPGGFLSSQYLDPVIILKLKELDYASYIFWQKYPSNLMLAAFDGDNIFSLEDYVISVKSYVDTPEGVIKGSKDYRFLNGLQKVAYISGSAIVGPALFMISLKTFRWTNR